MKIIIAGIVLLVSITFSGFSQSNIWTLEDCINHAWENNLHIKQQQLSLDIAKQNLKQSRGNLFPTLNATAAHGYNYGRTIDPFTNEFATESVRSNNFSVSSGVTLFNGFQTLNSIRQSTMELMAGEYDVETAKNDIALAIASAYLQIMFSVELVDIAKNQLEITRQQLLRTEKLVEA